MFKNESDFEKILSRLNIDTKSNPTHRENLRRQMLSVFNKARTKTSHAGHWQTIGRTIMKRPITKLAAAAVIVIAVVLSITFLDKSVTPAYALEQTIEAFKNVRFLHLVRHDESGQIEDERWIEIGMDGRQVRYRQDHPPNFLAVEDGKTTAVYHMDKNTVVLWSNREKQYQWVGDLGVFLENLRQDGKIIEENAEYWGQPAHRVLWPMMNAECYVDPETKLPIAIGDTELSYEQPPQGTFEISIPEGFAVVDNRPGASKTEEPDWLKDEERADRYFHHARFALASGDYDEAVELFEYVVEKQPGRNWAWYWLGRAYYEQGNYDFAIEKFSQVIDMMGDVPYCSYARGLAYAQKGIDEAAKDDLGKALPWMIRALREPTGAAMFEYADDPRLREGRYRPTEQQILARMTNRLRIITGQNFGYDPDAIADENERAMAAWENWYQNSGQIEFTPDAELVPIPEPAQELGK